MSRASSEVGNASRRSRGAKGVENCGQVDELLQERPGHRCQMTEGREYDAAKTQRHTSQRALQRDGADVC